MSHSLLHILNGDATLGIFPKSQLKGDIMVWREVLVQGALFYQIDTELFWEMRSQYMEIAYGSRLSEYKRKVIQEFQKLKRFSGEEITLWFEYDLFCQINMVALLSYLLKNKKECKISLVCVGEFPGHQKLLGLGELTSDDYMALFENRSVLNRTDLLLADKAWMAFCGKEYKKFDQFSSNTFKYLNSALLAAKEIFKNGDQLSPLEKKILHFIRKNKFTKKQLLGHLLSNDKVLGFGDLQYENIIEELSPHYFEENGILKAKSN